MLDQRPRGFSLIEVAIALVILGFLMTMGLPAFQSFLANSRLRATTDTFYSGLQSARGQAVTRNVPVQFVMTTDDLSQAIDPNTTNLSTSGLDWLTRTADPAIPGNFILLSSKPSREGSGGTPSVQVASTVSSVTFNSLGGTTLGGAATLQFTNPIGGACAPAGPMRCLNIVVSIGGQIRMCDPAVTAASDTRKC